MYIRNRITCILAMKRQSIFLLFCALVVGIAGCKENQPGKLPPPNVQVVEVIQQNIPITEEFVGQTYGLFDISIRARVEGFLERIYFEEGSGVKKGQLLYTIDPQPFEANVSGFISQVAEANTMLVKAQSDLNRIQPLAEIDAVSQSDLDAAVAHRDAAQASVEAAEATLELAQIELGYTEIYSPINGIIGKTEAYPGDFVGRGMGDAVLNEVSRIDTILVNFHIPEEQYLRLVRPILLGTDSLLLQRLEKERGLTLILADESVYPYQGEMRFVNRQVNPTTGTILLQASFPNPNLILRPGQFARVKAVVDVIPDGLIIPQRCVQEVQGVYSVYVMTKDNKIEYREIEVGPTFETSYWIIIAGLKPGEKVIYEGLQKAKSGMEVNPTLYEIPDPSTKNI